MPCCKPYQFPFANVAVSSIPYTDDMKANLGSTPKIDVFYWDPEAGEYYSLNGAPGTGIKFDDDMITVDHGGVNSGIVKVS